MGLAVEVQVEDHFYLQQEHCLWWRFWTRAPKECHDVELEGLGHPDTALRVYHIAPDSASLAKTHKEVA